MSKTAPTVEELELGLKIDRHNLEVAAQEQPELFYRVSKSYEMAISERDGAEQNVKTAEAEVDREIRKKAANSEEKTTETQIKSQVRIHPKVKAAEDEYLRLKEECGLLQALKDAFKQRGYAIGQLVELYLGNYYSEIKKDAGDSDRKKMRGRQGREAMAEGRRNRGEH